MSIPILWKDPFSFNKTQLFIPKYFSSLDEDEKLVLKGCGINTEFPQTLFNYARFLKVLDLSQLESKVKQWIDLHPFGLKPYYSPLMYHIINLLFKLFIESGATLNKLVLYFSECIEIKPEIFYSLGQNELFFSRLQDLSMDIILDFDFESATTLLKILAKNTTKINTMKLVEFDSYYEPQIFHALISLIKSQEQLKQFNLSGGDSFPTEFHGIISALECQTKSLQEVVIENCACSTEFEVLTKCENLKVLRIRFCEYEKLLNILDYKINTLEVVDCPIDASNIVRILEKSGSLLQRLKFESVDEEIWTESLLLGTLKSFCPNITYLNISYVEFSAQLLELIGNLQKLQFLTLWCIVDMREEELKMRVMRFAEILPLTLQYLDLRKAWLSSYIDILLNHCDAPLKSLLIGHLISEKEAKALIEFCTRKRTLNYVGVEMYLDNIKKEVEGYVALLPYKDVVVNC